MGPRCFRCGVSVKLAVYRSDVSPVALSWPHQPESADLWNLIPQDSLQLSHFTEFVFSHIMFLKNDDVNAGNVQLGQGVSGVAFPLRTGPKSGSAVSTASTWVSWLMKPPPTLFSPVILPYWLDIQVNWSWNKVVLPNVQDLKLLVILSCPFSLMGFHI